jgi:hypothetical protein
MGYILGSSLSACLKKGGLCIYVDYYFQPKCTDFSVCSSFHLSVPALTLLYVLMNISGFIMVFSRF